MEVRHISFIKYVVDQDGRLRAFNIENQALSAPFSAVEYHTELNKDLHLISFS